MQSVKLTTSGTCLVAEISAADLGFKPTKIWSSCPGHAHETAPYAVPKEIRIGMADSPEAGARFTPPLFAVVIHGDGGRRMLVTVAADTFWHRFSFVWFKATSRGVQVRIDLEGHTPLVQAKKHIKVYLEAPNGREASMDLVARVTGQLYPAAFAAPRKKDPDWWRLPSYNGWGDQVGASIHMEGHGSECRALVYNTQGLYQRWVDKLDAAGMPIGTICIDAGWSPGGVWQPFGDKWPDLRGFIDAQHAKGRKVLLWLATWYTEGLPDKWCVHLNGKRLVADVTNKEYMNFLKESTANLVSKKPGGLNCDGFKIDQLAYVPTEVSGQTRGGEHFGRAVFPPKKHPKIKLLKEKTWGLELLYELQKAIHDAAHNEKSDCMVSSSTVHPYFHDTIDMVRLHDTGLIKSSAFPGMKARADLAHAALPHKVVDADNWVHTKYDKWVDYTMESYKIGVPCIFYAEYFPVMYAKVKHTLPIQPGDLKMIAKQWKKMWPYLP